MILIDIRQQLACIFDTITGWCGTMPYEDREDDDLVEINDAECPTRNEMEVIKNGTD